MIRETFVTDREKGYCGTRIKHALFSAQQAFSAGTVCEERQIRAKLPTEGKHVLCLTGGVQIFRPVIEAI